MNWAAIQWGDAGTWVSGVATVLAFVTAFYFSRRQERRNVEQEVANVYAWLEFTVPESDAEAPEEWTLIVNNRTEAPLYQWSVRVRWTIDGQEETDIIGESELGIIPPGLRTYTLTDASRLPTNDAQVFVAIDFVDRMGRRRTRSETGGMTKRSRWSKTS